MTPQWNFDLNCRQKINNLEQYLCELLHAISHSHPSAANYLTETVKASLSSTTSLKVYSQLVNVNVSFLKSTYITIWKVVCVSLQMCRKIHEFINVFIGTKQQPLFSFSVTTNILAICNKTHIQALWCPEAPSDNMLEVWLTEKLEIIKFPRVSSYSMCSDRLLQHLKRKWITACF